MKLKFSLALLLRPFLLAATVVGLASSTVAKDSSLFFLEAGQPDAATILAPPPAPGSAEQAADLEEVRAVYHAATSNDVASDYAE